MRLFKLVAVTLLAALLLCGCVVLAETDAEHVCNGNAWISVGGGSHKQGCDICGKINGFWNNTCEDRKPRDGVCDLCHAAITHKHKIEIKVLNNGYHKKECACGNYSFTAVCNIVNGVCTECGAVYEQPTAAPTATATVKPTATATATVKPTATATATVKPTATATATVKPTATATATVKPTATATATVRPTATATATVKPTAAPTATVKPTAAPTATPTVKPIQPKHAGCLNPVICDAGIVSATVKKAATCTEAGSVENAYKCGLKTVSTIPALGHEYANDKCVVCGKKEPKYYYNNTMTSFGPTTRELVGGKDWYRVTPVDLSIDGAYTYDLIASNRYVVGRVNIVVRAGMLTVNYKVVARPADIKNESLMIYTSKDALASGDAISANVGDIIDIAKTFGDDTKVIVSLILTADYDAAGHNVTTMVVDNAEIAAMIAEMD